MKRKRGQISMEYLMIMGFVTLIISIILGVAFFYINGVKDQTQIGNINQFAQKVISTAEYVFYAGEPSKATIEAYLPDRVTQIQIQENTLTISFETSSGLNIISFPSTINITGSITSTQGIKRISIAALNGQSSIQMA